VSDLNRIHSNERQLWSFTYRHARFTLYALKYRRPAHLLSFAASTKADRILRLTGSALPTTLLSVDEKQ